MPILLFGSYVELRLTGDPLYAICSSSERWTAITELVGWIWKTQEMDQQDFDSLAH